jgi:endoglucanase
MSYRRSLALFAISVIAGLSLAGPASAQVSPQGANPASPNPLVGLRWFVDYDWHPSWDTYRSWKYRRPGDARQILKIAMQPQFRWFGKWDTNPYRKVTQYMQKVERLSPGTVPTLTVFRHPKPKSADPDGNGRSANDGRRFDAGVIEDRRYIRWVRWFARGVGHKRAVIAFEPDALGSFKYLSKRARRARLNIMREGIDILSKLPNATVYIEGGASDWRKYTETVRQLRYIGVHKVRGFMLNVTHFDWTHRNIAHGLKISRALGGKPFVISTHGNGRGPLHYRKRIGGKRRRVNVWCNPRNSALGTPPTTRTAHPKVDAYLWIGRAGYSAGRCGGGKKAGHWWAERGLMMARRAPWGPSTLVPVARLPI